MKKRILLVSESMGGGLRKHVVQLIENLDTTKFDIYFIHGNETLDENFMSVYSHLKIFSKVYSCDSLKREIDLKNDWKAYKFISKKIREINPDVVHCHSSKAGAIGRVAAKINGVKKIYYTPHAYSFLAPEFSRIKRNLFIQVEKYLSRFATGKTFNVSKSERDCALEAKIDKKGKFEVIYNGIPEIQIPDKKKIRQQLNFDVDSFIVGNNARMSKQKNPSLFLEIAKEVISIDRNYHFVWTGDGPLLEESKEFVNKYNLTENIHFLGDRKDAEIIVSAFDLFLITSLYEGLPYAPIEAMRVGIPILATEVVGNIEIVNKQNGDMFSIDDKEKAIQFILDKKRISNYKSEEIVDIFKKNFLLNNMIKKIENFYINYENGE